MDNETTVVKLMECLSTVLVLTNISPLCPSAKNIRWRYHVHFHGQRLPFDVFDLLLSNLTPSKRTQMLQGFFICHLGWSTN